MKNKTTKIITFIGTVALSLSALFVSVGSASGGNPFGANPPSFFDAIPVIPIDQIVDVNEPTVQYDNECNPFHELDVMITNNSVGLDQEFSVYIMPGNPEGIAFPIYADNHVEVASMTSVVVSFVAIPADNVDLNLLVYINPMDIDEPLLDVSIDACPWPVILPPIDDENEDEVDEEAPVVVEGDDEEDGEEAPVEAEGDDEEDGEEAPVEVENNDDNSGQDAPVEVENNDDNSGQDAPVEVVNNDDNSGQDAPVEVVNNDDNSGQEVLVDDEGNDPVIVWGNTTNNNSLNNNDGNAPVIEEIGKPAKPKVDPEDPKDTGDSDESASIEGKDSQGKSGLSILWIILIIVGGVATVGTTTRAIQKNNS